MADHKAEDTANDGAPSHERALFVMLIVFRRIHFVIARYTSMFRRALSARRRKGWRSSPETPGSRLVTRIRPFGLNPKLHGADQRGPSGPGQTLAAEFLPCPDCRTKVVHQKSMGKERHQQRFQFRSGERLLAVALGQRQEDLSGCFRRYEFGVPALAWAGLGGQPKEAHRNSRDERDQPLQHRC